MGDLDGRSSGGVVAIEHQQPMSAKGVQDAVSGAGRGFQLFQLGPSYPSSGVLVFFVDGLSGYVFG